MKRRRRTSAAAAEAAAIDYTNPSESQSGTGPAASGSLPSGGRLSSRPRGGGTDDYFGPHARTGPYTDASGFTPVEGMQSMLARGVPLSPDSPGDIVPPVEIGHSRENSNVTSPGIEMNGEREEEVNGYLNDKVPETTEHRVELP